MLRLCAVPNLEAYKTPQDDGAGPQGGAQVKSTHNCTSVR